MGNYIYYDKIMIVSDYEMRTAQPKTMHGHIVSETTQSEEIFFVIKLNSLLILRFCKLLLGTRVWVEWSNLFIVSCALRARDEFKLHEHLMRH